PVGFHLTQTMDRPNDAAGLCSTMRLGMNRIGNHPTSFPPSHNFALCASALSASAFPVLRFNEMLPLKSERPSDHKARLKWEAYRCACSRQRVPPLFGVPPSPGYAAPTYLRLDIRP